MRCKDIRNVHDFEGFKLQLEGECLGWRGLNLKRRPVTLIVTQVTSCVFSPFAGTHYFVAGMSQVTSYSLALLKLMDERYESTRQPPLGIARRVGAESSTFDMPAHKILLALITHAQSPETIAKEFVN